MSYTYSRMFCAKLEETSLNSFLEIRKAWFKKSLKLQHSAIGCTCMYYAAKAETCW